MRALYTLPVASLALAVGCAARTPAVDRLTERELSWQVRALDGREPVTIGTLRRSVLVLNLWATWCAPCVAELASFERLRARLDREDVAFAFVTYESAERVRAFAARHGITLPLYLEVDPVPESLGVRALPTTLVIDAHGKVVLRHRGAGEWDTQAVVSTLRELSRP